MAEKDPAEITEKDLDKILNSPEILEKIKEGEKLLQSGELQELINDYTKRKYTLSERALCQRQVAAKRPRKRKVSPDNFRILYREATTLCNTLRKALERFEGNFLHTGNDGA
jgi:hypothetical protein